MEFKLSFNLDNAAFDGVEPAKAVADILRALAAKYEYPDKWHDGSYDKYKTILDSNGNGIGTYRLK